MHGQVAVLIVEKESLLEIKEYTKVMKLTLY